MSAYDAMHFKTMQCHVVQKPSVGEPQPGEVIDQSPEEATNPADLQCKPRSITPTLKLMQCVI